MNPAIQPTRPPNGRDLVARGVKRRSPKPRHTSVAPPHAPEHLAWYAGLTVMALFEIIEWPVAIVIAVSHEIARRARSKAIRELAEGVEAGS